VKIVNVRRVGNSNVVSIPAEMQRLGYTSGTAVVIDEMPNGDLRIAPAARVREAMQRIITTVVEEDREALDLLQAHDRAGASSSADPGQ
jgi:antitoxin component of MazEF toxin-antitoxin module